MKNTNISQFERLVELMENNPDIAKGIRKFGSNKKNFQGEWNQFAVEFNSLVLPTREGKEWNEREDIRQKCTIEEFAIFFLNFVRSQTEKFVRGNTSCDTPRKHLISTNKSKISILPSSTKINTNFINTTNKTTVQNAVSNANESTPSSNTPATVLLHKDFKTYTTPTISGEKSTPSKNQSVVNKLPLSYIDHSNNSNDIINNLKSSKYDKINSKFDEGNLNIAKEYDNTEDDDNISSNSQTHFKSVSRNSQKKIILTKKYDNINNNSSFPSLNSIKSTSDRDVSSTDLGQNNFPKLDKNFKSNTSTPITKLNKSGGSLINNSSVTITPERNSSTGATGNSGNSGKSNKSAKFSKQSNISTSTCSRTQSSPLCLGDFFTSLSSTPSSSQKQKNPHKRNNKESTPRSSNNNSNNSSANISNLQRENGQERTYKPRRVIPTPVNLNDSAGSVSSFTSPAFRGINEGNILNISKEEIIDKTNCIIFKERAKLKSDMHAIVKEFAEEKASNDNINLHECRIQTILNDVKFCNLFETSEKSKYQSVNQNINPTKESSNLNTPVKPEKNVNFNIQSTDITDMNNEISIISTIDFNNITDKLILNRLVEIHSALIELNLVTNILNEFTYLINFFNIDIKDFVNFLESPTNVITTVTNTPSLVTKQISDNLNCISSKLSEYLSIEEHQPQCYEINKNTLIENNLIKPITNSNSLPNIVKTITTEELLLSEANAAKIFMTDEMGITLSEELKFQSSSATSTNQKLINRTTIDINLELVLKNFINCLFYSLGVLKKQRNLLSLLDTTSLRVMLDNEILRIIGKDLRDFLQQIYNVKIEIENSRPQLEISTKINNCGNFSNVSYQPDSDTRNNFTSSKECEAFKKQRDLFYVILRIWETKHLGEDWNFEEFLGNKIQMLLALSVNPINMAHLAKLFTSQLIISLNFTEPLTDLDLGLSNIDMNKLSKLRQRLVAPSHFSQDYQFPANQQFFKDFVLTAQSVIFIEQLKIVLISELLELNDSTYETIDLIHKTTKYNRSNSYGNNSNQENQENSNEERNNEIITFREQQETSGSEFHEYLVRPEIISTMRVLAKFLALLIYRLYHYEGNRNSLVDNKQIELRNMLKPEFDVFEILKKSVHNRRLIITLPWVIEFISMLDETTLKLDYYRSLMNYFFELYMKLTFDNDYNNESYYENDFTSLNKNSNKTNNITKINSPIKNIENIDVYLQNMRPTSIFILRTCLGWLFEQFNNTEDYYIYRQAIYIKTETVPTEFKTKTKTENMDNLSLNCSNINNNLKSDENIFKKLKKDEKNDKILSGEIFPNKFSILTPLSTSIRNEISVTENVENNLNIQRIINTFDPLLESILNVSCPFLADFRVSIMPTKLSKSLSRTGRLRHITTKILPDKKIVTNPIVDTTLSPIAQASTDSTSPATLNFHQFKDKNPVLFSSNKNESLNSKIERDSQTKLIEAFLHSQSLSVRRIIEFVIERTTSAVIKDFQMEVILKSKTHTTLKVEKIVSSDVVIVKNEMTKIFQNALQEIILQWDAMVANMIEVRTEKALDALLPNETLPVIKSTCASIIIQKCKTKTENWKQSSLTIQNFYCKDIDLEANKFVKNFVTKKIEQSTNLEINLNKNPLPSQILSQLQFWLHATNLRHDFVNEIDLKKFCDDLQLTLNSHILPTTFYKLCGITTVILIQNLVLKHSNIVTDSLMQKFINIWYVDKMLEFSQVEDPVVIKKNNKGDSEESSQSEKLSEDKKRSEGQNKYNIFDSYFAESFLKPLCGSKSLESIEKYANITVNIITNNLLTISYVNDKFVSLFKQDWRPEEYENLKNILERISSNTQIKNITHDADDSKSSLFMEMLSDLLRDIDEF